MGVDGPGHLPLGADPHGYRSLLGIRDGEVVMDLRERVARLLFVDATAGTGFCWDGELRQEGAHREAAYSLADAILAIFAEERRALEGIIASERLAAKERLCGAVAATGRAETAEARCAKLVGELEECKRLVECGEWEDVPSVVDSAIATVKDG